MKHVDSQKIDQLLSTSGSADSGQIEDILEKAKSLNRLSLEETSVLLSVNDPVNNENENKDNWPGLRCIDMVESAREIKDECSHEKRYYISRLGCDAKKFGNAVRDHQVMDKDF